MGFLLGGLLGGGGGGGEAAPVMVSQPAPPPPPAMRPENPQPEILESEAARLKRKNKTNLLSDNSTLGSQTLLGG